MISYILSALKTFVCWVLNKMWSLFMYLFGFMLDYIPEALKDEATELTEFIAKALYGLSEWYPVSYAVEVFTGLVAWKVVFLMLYFILRLLRG